MRQLCTFSFGTTVNTLEQRAADYAPITIAMSASDRIISMLGVPFTLGLIPPKMPVVGERSG